MRNALIAAAALTFTIAPPACAQSDLDISPSATAPFGVSISAQVSAVFDCGPGTPVGILRTNYTDRFMGDDTGGDRIYAGLDNAAHVILAQALAHGARSGRADVVALAYEIDPRSADQRAWRPIGLFLHITEMTVADDGQPNFVTRVEFIPDNSRIQLSTN